MRSKVTLKELPPPTLSDKTMVAFAAATISLAIAKPNPQPDPVAPGNLKKRLKMLSLCASGIPGPESSTMR